MAVNETIVTGRKFRKLTDAASKKWQRISFWHKASDCEFNDGKTAEEKLGAIKGITTDLNVTVPGYAADATRVSELNNSLNGFEPILDSTGKITGYKTKAGADTVFPFSSDKLIPYRLYYHAWTSGGLVYGGAYIYFANKGIQKIEINTTRIQIDAGRYGDWASKISGSNDGSNWTQLYSGNNSSPGSSGKIDISNYSYICINREGSQGVQQADISIFVE